MSLWTVQPFFDPTSSTFTYLLEDGSVAVVIDPVLHFDPASGRTSTHTMTPVIDALHARNLSLAWVLETHVHADHLSGAHHLRQRLGGKIAVGAAIREVQATFKRFYHLPDDFPTDGRPFDRLLEDGDTLVAGQLAIRALHVPGHTPADMAYQIDDLIFTGDTLFMPDVGTARADFPGGDARRLYQSVRRLLDAPGTTRLAHCHDYPPAAREPQWESTIDSQRKHNIHIRDGISEADFIAMRTARDATLPVPRLMLPALQVNIRAGARPPAEDNGVSYLKIPIHAPKASDADT